MAFVISGHYLLKSIPTFEKNDQRPSEEVLMAMGDHCGAAGVGGDHPYLPVHQQVHHQTRYVCVSSTTLEVFRGQRVSHLIFSISSVGKYCTATLKHLL